ncbi:Crp/Fnr family transcriptional regulator [candidate division WOR-3 bacterium]|nr:Crp/Fnr family transcriptional regulator [candidate division WOR-3 bacterium]
MKEDTVDISEKKIFYKKGEIIFSEGDTGNEMYLIKSGNVRIYKLTGRIQHTLAVLKEGNFFGEMAILDQSPRSASAEASTDVELVIFDKEAFISNIRKNPFIEFVVNELISRLRVTSNQFKLLAIPDDELRFATVLLNKAQSFAENKTDDSVLTINIDPEGIAASVGIKDSSARKMIENLMESEVISYQEDKIRVNIEKLKEFIRYIKLKTKFETESQL